MIRLSLQASGWRAPVAALKPKRSGRGGRSGSFKVFAFAFSHPTPASWPWAPETPQTYDAMHSVIVFRSTLDVEGSSRTGITPVVGTAAIATSALSLL